MVSREIATARHRRTRAADDPDAFDRLDLARREAGGGAAGVDIDRRV
jgi:hypothetical protein